MCLSTSLERGAKERTPETRYATPLGTESEACGRAAARGIPSTLSTAKSIEAGIASKLGTKTMVRPVGRAGERVLDWDQGKERRGGRNGSWRAGRPLRLKTPENLNEKMPRRAGAPAAGAPLAHAECGNGGGSGKLTLMMFALMAMMASALPALVDLTRPRPAFSDPPCPAPGPRRCSRRCHWPWRPGGARRRAPRSGRRAPRSRRSRRPGTR